MNPKLTQWIEDEIETRGMTIGHFSLDHLSSNFLRALLETAAVDRRTWTKKEVLNVQVFRQIKRGRAVPIKKNYWGYYVDENSSIYRLDANVRVLKSTQTVAGYQVVNLNNGKQKTFLVQRLVAKHHVNNPDPERLTDVHHLDNDRGNNRAWNLMWTSHGANMRLVTLKEKGYISVDRICPYCGEISPPT